MSPWIFLLFIVVFDLGFFNYASIAAENAARSGVMYTSQNESYVNDQTMACQIALRELRGMPNVSAQLTTCPVAEASAVDGSPIAVLARKLAVSRDGAGLGTAQVAVTYLTPQLFPIPGLMGRMRITRVAEARIRDN